MSLIVEYILPITLLTALGSGLNAGLFFVFSNTVMKALSRLPPDQGMAAMQNINITIINPLFMIVFFGTAFASTILIVHSLLQWSIGSSPWLLFGSLFYLVGTFLVTLLFNVPLNNKLAILEPSTDGVSQSWLTYVARWQPWNHVRTVTSIISTITLMYAATRIA